MKRSQPALRIRGDRIRQFRKAKGLSQAQLADGICTQATISLIEKRNKMPSMEILVRLVERLGVALDDVLVENQTALQGALRQADQMILDGLYLQAGELLAKVDLKKITQPEDLKRYHYDMGMFELFGRHDQDEAIYYFGRVLNGEKTEYRDLANVMATLGLGLAYAEKKADSRARVYIDQALELLAELPMLTTRYQEAEIIIYWQISLIFYRLSELQMVLKYSEIGIDIAVKNRSLYLLDELYVLRAQAMAKSDDAEAAKVRRIALSLAEINDKQELIQKIEGLGGPLSA